MLIYAIIFINLALLFYTVGVWSEKLQKRLKSWHIFIFWIGLVFDTLGTSFMAKIAGTGFTFSFHSLTGLLAIFLMLIHVVWASWVMLSKNKKMQIEFHKFSLFVWILWLVPFLYGVFAGMTK